MPPRKLPPSLSGGIEKNQLVAKRIKEVKAGKIPNQHNTLIYDQTRDPQHTAVYNSYFNGIKPTDLVFIYFDDATAEPTETTPTINGHTLQEINAGADYPSDRDNQVIVQKDYPRFDDKKKRDVVAVMYNNKRNKVKFASKNEVTGLPHFYTEEIDLSNGDHVRYYGTFMAKENTSFGKRRKTKRKTSKLENYLKYLLKL
jgi:hypothetical protein